MVGLGIRCTRIYSSYSYVVNIVQLLCMTPLLSTNLYRLSRLHLAMYGFVKNSLTSMVDVLYEFFLLCHTVTSFPQLVMLLSVSLHMALFHLDKLLNFLIDSFPIFNDYLIFPSRFLLPSFDQVMPYSKSNNIGFLVSLSSVKGPLYEVLLPS